jgi:hypothetical protein
MKTALDLALERRADIEVENALLWRAPGAKSAVDLLETKTSAAERLSRPRHRPSKDGRLSTAYGRAAEGGREASLDSRSAAETGGFQEVDGGEGREPGASAEGGPSR